MLSNSQIRKTVKYDKKTILNADSSQIMVHIVAGLVN